jgi:hypothetical protein
MSKWIQLLIGTLVLLLSGGVPVFATEAPVRVESPNYGIESMFFNSTGSLVSLSASVAPVITSGPTATNIALTEATVIWTTDKLTSSFLFFGSEAGVYTSQIGSSSASLVKNHSLTLERLTRGTTYHYKIHSVDENGNIVESPDQQFTTDAGDITPPIITTGPFISLDSASLVTVTWETNEIASTIVEYGVKDVTENAIGQADDLTLFHQVHISGLTPAQGYIWRVKTKDVSGNVTFSATQKLATPTSPFISGFFITDTTLTSAVVQWNTSTASTTVVEYGTQSSRYDKKVTDDPFSTNHILRLADLVSGTTYYLRVSGVDQAGNLLQSDEKVFATVVIPQITDLRVDGVTADTAVVTWHSSSEIDELLRYEITDHPDKSFIGKKFSGGNDTLVTNHNYALSDLESSTTYVLSVLGKDVFGNQASSSAVKFTTLPDSTPPELVNVQSDTTIDLGSKQTVQVLVSCELSELAKVVIEYGTGSSGPYDKKVETDATFSRAKFLVIPGLQPGQTYHYHLLARDRVGNLTTSPDYLVLAPSQPVSLLDLIFGQIRQNFGWLTNL